MKKLFLVCMTLLLVFAMPVAAQQEIPQERQLPRLVDEADLLDTSEEEKLLALLDEISERQECDVAVVTVNGLDGKSSTAYADDFYDYNGYGYGAGDDGILLLISMEDRDWAISTYGFGITAFTDAGLDYMADEFIPYISDGDYYDGFACYAKLCDRFLTKAANGAAYDYDNLPKEIDLLMILIGFGVGAIVALIVVTVMKGKLKSVRWQQNAASYTRPGSFAVRYGNEMFLYHHVSRVRRESSSSGGGGSSTRSSSSGRSHGGRSGKF